MEKKKLYKLNLEILAEPTIFYPAQLLAFTVKINNISLPARYIKYINCILWKSMQYINVMEGNEIHLENGIRRKPDHEYSPSKFCIHYLVSPATFLIQNVSYILLS